MDIEVKKSELEATINNLDNKTKELEKCYKKLNDKLKQLDGTNEVWSSDSQKTLYEYYLEVSKEFPNIVLKFRDYSKFLNNTLSNYVNLEKSIDSDVVENEENLNIN